MNRIKTCFPAFLKTANVERIRRKEYNHTAGKEAGGLIEVKNRRLEQFFFVHAVDFISCRKDPADGMTVWTYEDNEENRRILSEFQEAIRRREAQKKREGKG